jgi:hypothetical protein
LAGASTGFATLGSRPDSVFGLTQNLGSQSALEIVTDILGYLTESGEAAHEEEQRNHRND